MFNMLNTKTFLLRALRVFGLFFVLGAVVWAVQIRLFEVVSQEGLTSFESSLQKTSPKDSNTTLYALVLLTDVEEDSQVVYQYPHIESPLYFGRILSFEKKKGYRLSLDQKVFLPKELILGRVLYKFRF